VSQTLLVIDDEPVLQKLIQRRGEQEGWRVLSALTVRDGFNLAVEERPDVILLDLRLPDGGGCELLKKLKADARTLRIPIVVWSGRDGADEKRSALVAGAEAYLPKSEMRLTIHTLRAVLRGSGSMSLAPSPTREGRR
jgi:DNA-binding response OmpR family regulator